MATKVVRAPMPANRRAKQFAPFQALAGLNEAIANRERIIIPRRELAEDAIAEMNKVLVRVEKGALVTAVYYCDHEQNYLQLTGVVTKIDPTIKVLQLGKVTINFGDLSNLWIGNN